MNKLDHLGVPGIVMPQGLSIELNAPLFEPHALLKYLHVFSLDMEVVPEEHLHSSVCRIKDVRRLNIQESRSIFVDFPLIGPFDNALKLVDDRLECSYTLVRVGMQWHTEFEIIDIVIV
jgi:hypothetical protein